MNVSSGSPPQVRGKQTVCGHAPPDGRITPAGAGKTGVLSTLFAGGVGSPPQVRGKLSFNPYIFFRTWITPAGAGKTHFITIYSNATKDHPRRCGENLKRVSCHWAKPGSPPQVRGKPEYIPIPQKVYGITPAGAGKTSFS